MRTLTIDITDVGGNPRDGDYVLLQAPLLRGSSDRAGAVVMTAPMRVDLRNGVAQAQVESGPLLVQIRSRSLRDSEPFEVTVPNGSGPVTLRACMEKKFRYQPLVETAVARNADRAHEALTGAITAQRKATEKADEAIQRVDAAVNRGADLIRNEVKKDADRAVTAAQEAQQSTSVAVQAQSAATEAKTNAASSAATAQSAAEKAESAATSATSAAEKATKAEEKASQWNEEAAMSRSLADRASESAASYRDSAQEKATKAEEHAGESKKHADEAKQAAAQAKTGAPETGWAEQNLSEDVRRKLNKTLSPSDLNNMPRDLNGGSAENSPNTVMTRDPQGRSQVGDPARFDDIANKRYVDQLKIRRQSLFITRRPIDRTGNDVAPVFDRLHGSVNYGQNIFMIPDGIWRVSASSRREDASLPVQGTGKITIKVMSEGKWLAAADADNGGLNSASLIVDTRGLSRAVASVTINAQVTGTNMIVLVEDLTK